MALKFNPITGQFEDDADQMGAVTPPPAATPVQPAGPSMDPIVQDYVTKKFNLGNFTNENRSKLAEESKLSFGDKVPAALMALGAGFMGKDPSAAGMAALDRAAKQKRQGLEDFDIGRKNLIEEFDLDRKATQAGREDEAYSRDEDKRKREDDPNSEESQLADGLLRKMGYKGPPVSATKFKSFSPTYQKMYEIAERAKDRAEAREQRNFTRDQARQDKMEKEAKPSEKQVKEFTEFDNALDSIKSIRAQKGSQDTGPLSAAQSSVAQFFGMDDAEKSSFKSEVQDQLAQYIKSISGGAVSDQERASLMQNIPKMSDNDETFNKKLDALEARLERNRQNHLSNTEKMGKNVKQFERAPNQPKSQKIRVSNGKETLEIDESDLSDAEADGYKRI